MIWILGLMHLVLSLGDVNALIPIIVILILIVAAGGLTRGFDIFSLFGLGTLAGIGLGSRGSIAKGNAYDKSAPSGFKDATVSKIDKKEIKKIREQIKNKEITRWQGLKKMGAVMGGTASSLSAAAMIGSAYRELSKKRESKTSYGDKDSPNILKRGAKAGGTSKMSVRESENAVANRVRMAVMNEPPNFKPRSSVPEQPYSATETNYNFKPSLPFSSIEAAVAWSLSSHKQGGSNQGKPTMAEMLRTKEMKRLAAEDPKEFNRRYLRMARKQLLLHGKLHAQAMREKFDKDPRYKKEYIKEKYIQAGKGRPRLGTYTINLSRKGNKKNISDNGPKFGPHEESNIVSAHGRSFNIKGPTSMEISASVGQLKKKWSIKAKGEEASKKRMNNIEEDFRKRQEDKLKEAEEERHAREELKAKKEKEKEDEE